MLQATLEAAVLKGATTVSITPAGAISNFSAAGGDAYIGRDKLSYTGIASTTLTGCTEITFSHLAGENIDPHYGARIIDIAPRVLKSDRTDPDGLAQTIMDLLERGMFKHLKDYAMDVHALIDPVRAPLLFLKYICMNNGVEFGEDVSEGRKRSLARQCADVLSMRNTENAFRFMCWHVLGYDVDVYVERYKIPARMNDRNYRMYRPPTPFVPESRTVCLWNFTEGAGATSVNEIATGPVMTLHNVAMWTASSMFSKDTSITSGVVHNYAEAVAAAGDLGNLYAKEKFAVEFFMEPSVSANFPQKVIYKGTFFDVRRPNATDLTIAMNDGTTSSTVTVTDCITVDQDQCVAVLYDRPTLALLVDGNIVGMDVTFDEEAIDPGANWTLGDKAGANPFEGRLDTVRITSGKKYPAECDQYFEHINWLRSYATDADRNSYMLDDWTDDGQIKVTINNSDGDIEKEWLLKHLIEEWLTVANYEVIQTGHLPFELDMGLF